MKKYHRL